jgi:glycerol-3-phosphate dehydrogenase
VDAFLHADQGDPVFIQWILDNEDVVHLDDLMLRRTRLGLLLPGAGKVLLDTLRQQIQRTLGWDDARWEQERNRYLDIHQRYYGVPASPVQQAAG